MSNGSKVLIYLSFLLRAPMNESREAGDPSSKYFNKTEKGFSLKLQEDLSGLFMDYCLTTARELPDDQLTA